MWRRGDAEARAFCGVDCGLIGTPSVPFAYVRDASMRTAIVSQRTRMRRPTAPLCQDFARCIEPDTGEQQAKSQEERGRGEVFAPRHFCPKLRMHPGHGANQSINQSTNQPTNQPINGDYGYYGYIERPC